MYSTPSLPQCRRFYNTASQIGGENISNSVCTLFSLFLLFCFSFCRCLQQKQNLLQVLVGASPTLFTQTKRGVRAKAFFLAKTIQKLNSSKEPFGQPETHVALRKRK